MILTPLSKKDFKKILKNYNIGKYVGHKHIPVAMEHTVFLLKTTKGKFILKIYNQEESKHLKLEIKIRGLLQKKLPIPEIIKTLSGKESITHKNKSITVEKFVEGKGTMKLNKKMLINATNIMVSMHKKLAKIKIKDIPEEDHLKSHKYSVRKTFGFNFKDAEKKYLNEAKIVNKSKLRKSIIHSDFQDVNLLFKNNRVTAILDWADINKTAFVYDIAVFIAHSFVKKNRIEKEKIKTFFKIYQKEIKLNNDEKKAIYFMMKRRLLGALIWCYTMSKEHKDMAKELKKWGATTIKCYKSLDKMPLEEFLKLS